MEIARQVDAQTVCIETGKLDGIQEYVHSINLLLVRFYEELATSGETLDDTVRQQAKETLEATLIKHELNLKACEQQFEAVRSSLIGQFERNAQVTEYSKVQNRRRRQDG